MNATVTGSRLVMTSLCRDITMSSSLFCRRQLTTITRTLTTSNNADYHVIKSPFPDLDMSPAESMSLSQFVMKEFPKYRTKTALVSWYVIFILNPVSFGGVAIASLHCTYCYYCNYHNCILQWLTKTKLLLLILYMIQVWLN